jgi:predicted signal transduction protein with EAL and GGDEF domain
VLQQSLDPDEVISHGGGSTVFETLTRNRKTFIVISVVTVVFLALLVVLLVQHAEINRLSDPTSTSEQTNAEAIRLKEEVSKLMQLPDEEAVIATVQDADKLKEQEFFKDAKNGDKVLIFTTAQKAVIYRESENKIINSGPITLTTSNEEPR